ncbi:MAG: hypothetical protein AAF962_26445 [Actinomycetota bacterium]
MRRMVMAVAALAVGAVALVVSVSGTGPLARLPTDEGARGAGGGPGTVYFVELGRPPDYRLVASDRDGAESELVFAIPEGAAVFDVVADPDGTTLALSYTEDTEDPGSGLYLLDIEDPDGASPIPVGSEESGVFHEFLTFAPDGSTLWGARTDGVTSSVFALDLTTGELTVDVPGATAPAVLDDGVAMLRTASDGSRRSILLADHDGTVLEELSILDGRYDLGHLLADTERGRLLFTALIPPGEEGIGIGRPAGAHGPHDGPAQWLSLDLGDREVRRLLEHDPMGVRDATLLPDGELMATTTAGLVRIGDEVTTAATSVVIVLVAG